MNPKTLIPVIASFVLGSLLGYSFSLVTKESASDVPLTPPPAVQAVATNDQEQLSLPEFDPITSLTVTGKIVDIKNGELSIEVATYDDQESKNIVRPVKLDTSSEVFLIRQKSKEELEEDFNAMSDSENFSALPPFHQDPKSPEYLQVGDIVSVLFRDDGLIAQNIDIYLRSTDSAIQSGDEISI